MHSVSDYLTVGVLGSLFFGKQINLYTVVIGDFSQNKTKQTNTEKEKQKVSERSRI